MRQKSRKVYRRRPSNKKVKSRRYKRTKKGGLGGPYTTHLVFDFDGTLTTKHLYWLFYYLGGCSFDYNTSTHDAANFYLKCKPQDEVTAFIDGLQTGSFPTYQIPDNREEAPKPLTKPDFGRNTEYDIMHKWQEVFKYVSEDFIKVQKGEKQKPDLPGRYDQGSIHWNLERIFSTENENRNDSRLENLKNMLEKLHALPGIKLHIATKNSRLFVIYILKLCDLIKYFTYDDEPEFKNIYGNFDPISNPGHNFKIEKQIYINDLLSKGDDQQVYFFDDQAVETLTKLLVSNVNDVIQYKDDSDKLFEKFLNKPNFHSFNREHLKEAKVVVNPAVGEPKTEIIEIDSGIKIEDMKKIIAYFEKISKATAPAALPAAAPALSPYSIPVISWNNTGDHKLGVNFTKTNGEIINLKEDDDITFETNGTYLIGKITALFGDRISSGPKSLTFEPNEPNKLPENIKPKLKNLTNLIIQSGPNPQTNGVKIIWDTVEKLNTPPAIPARRVNNGPAKPPLTPIETSNAIYANVTTTNAYEDFVQTLPLEPKIEIKFNAMIPNVGNNDDDKEELKELIKLKESLEKKNVTINGSLSANIPLSKSACDEDTINDDFKELLQDKKLLTTPNNFAIMNPTCIKAVMNAFNLPKQANLPQNIGLADIVQLNFNENVTQMKMFHLKKSDNYVCDSVKTNLLEKNFYLLCFPDDLSTDDPMVKELPKYAKVFRENNLKKTITFWSSYNIKHLIFTAAFAKGFPINLYASSKHGYSSLNPEKFQSGKPQYDEHVYSTLDATRFQSQANYLDVSQNENEYDVLPPFEEGYENNDPTKPIVPPPLPPRNEYYIVHPPKESPAYDTMPPPLPAKNTSTEIIYGDVGDKQPLPRSTIIYGDNQPSPRSTIIYGDAPPVAPRVAALTQECEKFGYDKVCEKKNEATYLAKLKEVIKNHTSPVKLVLVDYCATQISMLNRLTNSYPSVSSKGLINMEETMKVSIIPTNLKEKKYKDGKGQLARFYEGRHEPRLFVQNLLNTKQLLDMFYIYGYYRQINPSNFCLMTNISFIRGFFEEILKQFRVDNPKIFLKNLKLEETEGFELFYVKVEFSNDDQKINVIIINDKRQEIVNVSRPMSLTSTFEFNLFLVNNCQSCNQLLSLNKKNLNLLNKSQLDTDKCLIQSIKCILNGDLIKYYYNFLDSICPIQYISFGSSVNNRDIVSAIVFMKGLNREFFKQNNISNNPQNKNIKDIFSKVESEIYQSPNYFNNKNLTNLNSFAARKWYILSNPNKDNYYVVTKVNNKYSEKYYLTILETYVDDKKKQKPIRPYVFHNYAIVSNKKYQYYFYPNTNIYASTVHGLVQMYLPGLREYFASKPRLQGGGKGKKTRRPKKN